MEYIALFVFPSNSSYKAKFNANNVDLAVAQAKTKVKELEYTHLLHNKYFKCLLWSISKNGKIVWDVVNGKIGE